MSSPVSAAALQTSLLDARAAQLLERTRSSDPASSAGRSASVDSAAETEKKIVKSSKDFESILLGSWLQQAEQSFATVPGGDGDDDDSGKDQFQGIAMQALAGSLTASGGIGISRMIAEHLRSASGGRSGAPASSAGTTGDGVDPASR